MQEWFSYAGYYPGLGAVPDVINAGIYAARGRWQLAGLAAIVAVPIIGDALGVGRKGLKAAENLSRLGKNRESAGRLARKAAEAEAHLGIHGVSTTTGGPKGPASTAERTAVEQSGFRVHDTPTRNDPLHKTVELPKPVTQETADRFNRLFGRE